MTNREKINAAIQDMPENEEIKQLLSGSCKKKNIIIIQKVYFSYVITHILFLFADIHYFHCLQIIEILKGTEASSKNIFGRYSSQRMKVMMHLCAVYYSFHV